LRYFERTATKAPRYRAAVIAAGMKAARIAAKEVELELRCPPEPGAYIDGVSHVVDIVE
jgi:hypothetical protein